MRCDAQWMYANKQDIEICFNNEYIWFVFDFETLIAGWVVE